MKCAAVFVAAVEIYAVIAYMVENAVEDDAYAAFVAAVDECFQCFIAAEHGVNAHIVACVVLMVGIGGENGAKIDEIDAERGYVVKPVRDACQGAAEKCVVPQKIALLLGVFGGVFFPVEHYRVASRRVVAAFCEAVDEDMVYCAARKSVFRRIAVIADEKLPFAGEAVGYAVGRKKCEAAVLLQLKVKEKQPLGFRVKRQ